MSEKTYCRKEVKGMKRKIIATVLTLALAVTSVSAGSSDADAAKKEEDDKDTADEAGKEKSEDKSNDEKDKEMKYILLEVYDALKQKGYNPISQIVGYILSEDPTYITTYNNARSLVRKLDRDELLKVLVKSYLDE